MRVFQTTACPFLSSITESAEAPRAKCFISSVPIGRPDEEQNSLARTFVAMSAKTTYAAAPKAAIATAVATKRRFAAKERSNVRVERREQRAKRCLRASVFERVVRRPHGFRF